MLTLCRRHNAIFNQYHISDVVLSKAEKFRDVGVAFDQKFKFNEYILGTIAKSYKSYSFIYRNYKEFSKLCALEILYNSLICTKYVDQ